MYTLVCVWGLFCLHFSVVATLWQEFFSGQALSLLFTLILQRDHCPGPFGRYLEPGLKAERFSL
jgi:hypothetical protein